MMINIITTTIMIIIDISRLQDEAQSEASPGH